MNPSKDILLPGDVLVKTDISGFVIERGVRDVRYGLRWEPVEKVGSLRFALQEARDLAIAAHARAWFVIDAQEYAPIPLDDEFSIRAAS
ncbi:MAG: hypothetical protein IT184_15985 [Acidobacteria bacterium]|nr:hypothetical protein [Acidobacteriota bacterium]